MSFLRPNGHFLEESTNFVSDRRSERATPLSVAVLSFAFNMIIVTLNSLNSHSEIRGHFMFFIIKYFDIPNIAESCNEIGRIKVTVLFIYHLLQKKKKKKKKKETDWAKD